MKRLFRMVVLLIVATVFSVYLPINLVIIAIAALAMESFELADVVIMLFGSFCLDQLNMLPLGFSFLPFLVMTCLVYVLRTQIYVQAMLPRLLWLTCAVGLFYITTDALLMARTGNGFYLWDGMPWAIIHALIEGSLAALLSPWLHWYLTVTLADLRQSRSIVVP